MEKHSAGTGNTSHTCSGQVLRDDEERNRHRLSWVLFHKKNIGFTPLPVQIVIFVLVDHVYPAGAPAVMAVLFEFDTLHDS